MRTNFRNFLKPALILAVVMCCFSTTLFSQDTTNFNLSRFYELDAFLISHERLIIYDCGLNCNYDSAKIGIYGDTMKVIRMFLKYYDLRNKQYYALQDLVRNIDNKQYKYYLKRYIAVRDSLIK
jgi:hypothetical protein